MEPQYHLNTPSLDLSNADASILRSPTTRSIFPLQIANRKANLLLSFLFHSEWGVRGSDLADEIWLSQRQEIGTSKGIMLKDT